MKIVKIAIVFIFLMNAENIGAQNLEFELFVRPSLTSLRGSELIKDNFDPTIYPSAGVGMTYLFENNYLINVGVMYDKKGGRGKNKAELRDENNEIVDVRTVTPFADFQYVTVPVQWGYRFGKRIQYQIGVGVYGAFLLKQEMGVKDLGYTGDTKEDGTKNYRKLDTGISSSFNVFIPIGKAFAFKVGVDNNLGLLDVRAPEVNGIGKEKHNSIGLSVGLKYSVSMRE